MMKDNKIKGRTTGNKPEILKLLIEFRIQESVHWRREGGWLSVKTPIDFYWSGRGLKKPECSISYDYHPLTWHVSLINTLWEAVKILQLIRCYATSHTYCWDKLHSMI